MNTHELPIINQQIITHTHEVPIINTSNIHQITHVLVQQPTLQQQPPQPQLSQSQHPMEAQQMQSQQSEHNQQLQSQQIQSHHQQSQAHQNQQVLHMQSQMQNAQSLPQQCQTQQQLQAHQPIQSQSSQVPHLKILRESSPQPLMQPPEVVEMKTVNIKTESQTEKIPKIEKEKDKEKDNRKKKEAIDSQAREIIFKVIKFFESEKQNRGYAFPVENVVKRACAATGLSESTIKRIKRDGLRAEATHTRMAGPKKKRIRKTKVQLDYYQLCALRTIVSGYSMRKEVPTLGKILTAAKEELQYKGGKESLRLILLNKLGIKFKKCEKKKKPPEEGGAAPAPQAPNVMAHPQVHEMKPQQMIEMKHPHIHEMKHPQMHELKPMENQCAYATMIHQIQPVSY